MDWFRWGIQIYKFPIEVLMGVEVNGIGKRMTGIFLTISILRIMLLLGNISHCALLNYQAHESDLLIWKGLGSLWMSSSSTTVSFSSSFLTKIQKNYLFHEPTQYFEILINAHPLPIHFLRNIVWWIGRGGTNSITFLLFKTNVIPVNPLYSILGN